MNVLFEIGQEMCTYLSAIDVVPSAKSSNGWNTYYVVVGKVRQRDKDAACILGFLDSGCSPWYDKVALRSPWRGGKVGKG